jgi:hypothetical protein
VVAPLAQVQVNQPAAAQAAAASASAASLLAGLPAGTVITARVLALLEGGQVQLAIGNALLDAATQVPLPLGATVQLAVQTTGTATTLQFVGQVDSQAALQGAIANAARQGTTAPSQPTIPQPPAVAIAVPAAGDAANGVAAPVIPAAAPVAAASAVTDATALALAELATAAAPQLAPAAAADAAVALQAAVRSAAATQGSLAPLFAEIAAAAGLPVLPEPVQREALRLLSLRPQLDGNLTAEDVKQAFADSGLLLEAQLAHSAQPSSGASSSGGANSASNAPASAAADMGEAGAASAAVQPQGDLKAALIVFRQLLATVFAQGEAAATPPDTAAARSPATTEAAPSVTALSGAAASAPQDAALAPTAHAASPPPPFRDGPTTAQPPAVATIDAATSPHEAVKTLLAATDGALARQTLLQAASLPTQPGAAGRLDNGGPRWLFEVPFATPQGTNVAQFEISRDGKAAQPVVGAGAVWRARFSIDVDPIGPVHAQIALRGVHAAVTLWAESPRGAARLRAGAAKLVDALRAADLEAGDLVVRDGAPRARTMPAGHFLDRAS